MADKEKITNAASADRDCESDCMSIDDLYLTCKEKAKGHTMFYHYTNLESLLKILSSRSFRLTQLALVNDVEEENRIDPIIRKKVFVACLNHHTEESIPLWNMYSKDKYGIRLGFPNIMFFEKRENYYYIDDEIKKHFPCQFWEIRDASVVDVEYVDDPTKHVDYMDHPIHNGKKITVSIDVGLVKRKAWSFEAETRARVGVDVKKGIASRLVEKKSLDIRYPIFDYIYCLLTDKVLSMMTITFNPFMSDELKNIVKQAVNSYILSYNPDNFINSTLENKIHV